jgi:hypothetical protein
MVASLSQPHELKYENAQPREPSHPSSDGVEAARVAALSLSPPEGRRHKLTVRPVRQKQAEIWANSAATCIRMKPEETRTQLEGNICMQMSHTTDLRRGLEDFNYGPHRL